MTTGARRTLSPKGVFTWDPQINHVEVALIKDNSGAQDMPRHFEVWNNNVYIGRVTSKIAPRSLQFASSRYWQIATGASPQDLVVSDSTRPTQHAAIYFLLKGH